MGSAIPRRIAGLYAVFGIVWILASDLVASQFESSPALEINVAKGCLFVAATSVLLYFVLRRVLSAQRTAERAVRASEARYRSLFDNTHAPMLIVDPADGRLVDANPAALRFYGYSRDQILCLTIADFNTLPADQIRQRISDVMDKGQYYFEAEHRLASGEVRPVDIYSGPIEIDGHRMLISLVLDASARHAAETKLVAQKEMAEQANRAKSEFLATMSHELRTPLNAILGFSEMIRNRMLGDQAIDRYAEYADAIQRSGRHLLELINDILDLSKIEAKRFELAEQDLEVRDVVTAALGLVEAQRVAKGVGVEDAVPAGLPRLHADRRAIEQVLINLLDNAIKFSPTGSAVSVVAAIEPGGTLAIIVADRGSGIPDEVRAHLFEPFHRQSSTLTHRYEGTGLGLSISRRLVELHGGTLTIDSVVGQGTTATLRFPVDRVGVTGS